MAPGILQVHPTARCNLRCRHCYTSSGPERTDALDDALLAAAVDDAAALGYRRLAVSGGEPLMFRGLGRLLAAGRDAGMRTLVTTNGTLATPARLEALAPSLDLLAFSLDGPPDQHVGVRGVPWAFDRLVAGLDAATALGIPHGVLFTVTASSWPYVGWAADFARDHGCALFQVHAVQGVGRARDEMREELLGDDLLEHAYVAAAAARAAHGDALRVHADLVHRFEVEALARRGAASVEGGPAVLVVEEDGVVVPHTHGFPRAGAVGDLRRERLGAAFPRFLAEVAPGLAAVEAATRDRMLAGDRRVFDWYAELTATATEAMAPRRPPLPVAIRTGGSKTTAPDRVGTW